MPESQLAISIYLRDMREEAKALYQANLTEQLLRSQTREAARGLQINWEQRRRNNEYHQSKNRSDRTEKERNVVRQEQMRQQNAEWSCKTRSRIHQQRKDKEEEQRNTREKIAKGAACIGILILGWHVIGTGVIAHVATKKIIHKCALTNKEMHALNGNINTRRATEEGGKEWKIEKEDKIRRTGNKQIPVGQKNTLLERTIKACYNYARKSWKSRNKLDRNAGRTRIILTNQIMQATNGNVEQDEEPDKIWCTEATTSLAKAAYQIEWQIVWWRNNIDQANRYLDNHYQQEERDISNIAIRTSLRSKTNQQTKENLNAIKNTIPTMSEALAELNKSYHRLKTTRARILEVTNPSTTRNSVLKNRTAKQNIEEKPTKCKAIKQELHVIWHCYARNCQQAYEEVEKAKKATETIANELKDMFERFQEHRTRIRVQRGFGGINEWSTMHSNELIDLAMAITDKQEEYARNRDNTDKEIEKYKEAHRELMDVAVAQLGVQDLENHGTNDHPRGGPGNKRPNEEGKKGKNKKRKRKAKRSWSRKGPTSKETHILHGNTDRKGWECICGTSNPAILTRCRNRQCGAEREESKTTREKNKLQENEEIHDLSPGLVTPFIGPKGRNIKEFGDRHKVRISINTTIQENGYCVLHIWGPPWRRESAEKDIKSWIQNQEQGQRRITGEDEARYPQKSQRYNEGPMWRCHNCNYQNRPTRSECCQCAQMAEASSSQNVDDENKKTKSDQGEDPWIIGEEEEQKLKKLRRNWSERNPGAGPTFGWWTCDICNRKAKLCEGGPDLGSRHSYKGMVFIILER